MLVRVGNIRPIDDQGPSHNVLSGNESPITTVGTVISVIAHSKITIGWNNNFFSLRVFPEIDITVKDVLVLLVIRKPIHLFFQEREVVAYRQIIVVRRLVKNVGFREQVSIKVKPLIGDSNSITRDSDGALDVVFR